MPSGYSYIGNLKIDENAGELVSQSVGSKALLPSAADQSTLEVNSSTGSMQVKTSGSTLANGIQREQMSKSAGTWIRGSLGTGGTSVGDLLKVQNTFTSHLLITRILIYVTTATTAGGDTNYCDIGTDDGGDASSNNLIDDLDLKNTGAFDNIANKGSGGSSIRIWKSGEYVVGTVTTTPTNLVGYYAIHVIDISQ